MFLVKNVVRVGSITFISRIFGYIRDVVVASLLGTSFINDAFIVAFRLPNLFRTIFGEGAFSSAFVPLFSKLIAVKGDEYARDFAAKVQLVLLACLFIFTVVMIIFMRDVIIFTAPGFINTEEKLEFITTLAQITFPYIFFVSLVAFYGGMLNTKQFYSAFASAPIILNITLILAVLFNRNSTVIALVLAYGVLLAGVLELLWMLYFAHKKNLIVGLKWPKEDENIYKLFRTLGPGAIGSGVSQINVWVSTILASFVPGGVSYLYYADRIYQLPLALIGVSIGTVLLPVLSKSFGTRNYQAARYQQNNAMEFCMFLSIPAAFAIFFLSQDLVKVLFERGEFNAESTLQTSLALSVFALGVPAYIINKIFSTTFFANHDTKTPVQIASIALVVNIGVSYIFLDDLQHVAIATGSIASAWINIIMLYYILYRKNWYRISEEIYVRIAKFFACAVFMLLTMTVAQKLINETNIYIALVFNVTIGLMSYLTAIVATKTYSIRKIKDAIIRS